MNPIEFLLEKHGVIFARNIDGEDDLKTFMLKHIRPGASIGQINVIFRLATKANNDRIKKLLGGRN